MSRLYGRPDQPIMTGKVELIGVVVGTPERRKKSVQRVLTLLLYSSIKGKLRRF